MSDYEELNADVLVIGGGSAGAMAAIRAKEVAPDARVVVFDKGHVKHSGSIPRGMDALNIVTVPGIATPADYVESAKAAADGIADETTCYRMAERSWDLLRQLESWGVCFPKGSGGEYEVLQVHPKNRFAVTMKEPELKRILYDRLVSLGCHVFNRTMAVRLLMQDGQVRGALGMHMRTGQLLTCRAPAVILTAGGTARFGLPENGYLYGVYDCPANTGDAYALAFRAGAELTGFEYTMSTYIIRDINAPLLYICLTRGARLLNALGQFIDQDHPSVGSMFEEHFRGHAPLFVRLSHLPLERIQAIEDILFTTERPVMQRFFQGRGIDFRTHDIELGPTEFFLCGGHGITGIAVDEHAASTVSGLYAAGDSANVSRGHLTGAFVYGQIAAENATERHRGQAVDCDVKTAVAEFAARRRAWEDNSGAIGVDEYEFKVRRMISGYATPPKNETKLRRAREELGRARRDLASQVRIQSVHDVVKAVEVENIITSGILSATASSARQESRWGFFHRRSDYPARSPEWDHKHVVLRRGETDDQVLAEARDIRTRAIVS